ncbi:type II toxin-antitoxin system VapC family toxin [Salmonella enterica subsp. enterica]|nr:type II toxin-antitoxin system VapC family toxin [Salmonella enterica subsp. enterica serovar Mikawasima]
MAGVITGTVGRRTPEADDIILVTNNMQEFRRVPGLLREDRLR